MVKASALLTFTFAFLVIPALMIGGIILASLYYLLYFLTHGYS